MTLFPIFVYRSPGSLKMPSGKTYHYVSVNDDKELELHLKNGWFMTALEAVEAAGDAATPKVRGMKAKKVVRRRKPSKPLDGINHRLIAAEEKELDLPPTREELVQKATELGLKFTKRTSDKKLLDMIKGE
jgi:hypothetical protein